MFFYLFRRLECAIFRRLEYVFVYLFRNPGVKSFLEPRSAFSEIWTRYFLEA